MSTGIRHILVLCEGNHCRSPLAEGLLRQALGDRVSVASAGLHAMVGQPAHEQSCRLGSQHGIDLGPHRGVQVSPEMALKADLILVMDEDQKDACERLVPSARGRVFLLGHWLPADQREILDPMGGDAEVHRQVFEHVRLAVPPWLKRLQPLHPRKS